MQWKCETLFTFFRSSDYQEKSERTRWWKEGEDKETSKDELAAKKRQLVTWNNAGKLLLCRFMRPYVEWVEKLKQRAKNFVITIFTSKSTLEPVLNRFSTRLQLMCAIQTHSTMLEMFPSDKFAMENSADCETLHKLESSQSVICIWKAIVSSHQMFEWSWMTSSHVSLSQLVTCDTQPTKWRRHGCI